MYPPHYNEADEVIYRDVIRLHRYLTDVIWIDEMAGRVRSARLIREDRGLIRCKVSTATALAGYDQTKSLLCQSRDAGRSYPKPRTFRLWSEIGAAERIAITNVRTVSRDLKTPALRAAVLEELDRSPSLVRTMVEAHKLKRKPRARKRGKQRE
jgi:hypothetical protein